MNNLQIEIETADLETRQKKGGEGSYQVQRAYVHTLNRDGSPKRYPEEIALFPPKDNSNNPIPYKPGKYVLDPRSFRVQGGFLDMSFPQLVAVKV